MGNQSFRYKMEKDGEEPVYVCFGDIAKYEARGWHKALDENGNHIFIGG